jgi:hypothetical protein
MARHKRKNAPHGARLQSDDDLRAALVPHTVYHSEVPPQRAFIEHKTWGGYFIEVYHLENLNAADIYILTVNLF